MKKWIVALLIGVITLSSASMAFAAGMPDDTKALFDQAKAERDKVKEMRSELQDKAAVLKGIVDQIKADLGVIPLTDDEKALLQSVREEIAPLTEQLKALHDQLRAAIESSDKEQADLLRQEISDLKAQIQEKWDTIGDLRDKVKSNHEKLSPVKTDEIKTMIADRKELREEAKTIKGEITALLDEIRAARSEEDFDTVTQKIDQLTSKLLEAESNITGRSDIIDSLITALSE